MKANDCPTLEVLSPYLDGELSPEETLEVRRHTMTCARCAERVSKLRGLDGLVEEALSPTPRHRVVRLGVAAAAASLLIAACLLSFGPQETPPEADEPSDILVRAEPHEKVRAPHSLRQRLASLDDEVALAALMEAGGRGDGTLVADVAGLRDRPGLTSEATFVMGFIGGRTAGRTLAGLLADESDEARRMELFIAVSLLEPNLAAPILADHLEDPAARVILIENRETMIPVLRSDLVSHRPGGAARALGLLGDERSVPLLAELLCRPETRTDAAAALADIGTSAALNVLIESATGGDSDPVTTCLVRAGPTAEALLVARFMTGGHSERRDALRLLGLCGGKVALPVLTRAADDPALADAAVDALGRLGRRVPGVVNVLTRCGQRSALRPLAIRALGVTGRAEAVPALKDLAVSRASTRLAIAALGDVRCDAAIEAVLSLMNRSRCETAGRRALSRHDERRVAAIVMKHRPVPLRTRRSPEV
jgi:HEAT repeat protein